MNLESSAFVDNGRIPEKYTCDGEDISPPLFFKNVPKSAISLALIMDDRDIPGFVKEKFGIEAWDHWVVYNIPAEMQEVKEGEESKGVLGKNTNKKLGYGGPCPPDREHRYFLRLFALDRVLNLKEGATKKEVLLLMKDHIIEKAELMGKYKRK